MFPGTKWERFKTKQNKFSKLNVLFCLTEHLNFESDVPSYTDSIRSFTKKGYDHLSKPNEDVILGRIWSIIVPLKQTVKAVW